MRLVSILFFSIIIFVCGCKKSATPQAPPQLQNASIILSNNRILISDYQDSIFIFNYNAGDLTLTKNSVIEGVSLNDRMAYESDNLIAFATNLFDQSFNEVHAIDFLEGDHPNFFIGISTNGQYVATNNNEIINTSTK